MAETATAEKSTDATILTETKPVEVAAETKLYPTAEEKVAADAALKTKQETDKAAADKVVADKAAQDKAKADAEAADKTKTQTETKQPTEEEKAAAEKARLDTQKEYALTPPEGSLVSAEEAKALTERAKKAGLTKEQAEGLLQERNDAKQYVLKSQQDEMKAARVKWVDEIKNDSIYGGEKLAENAEKARRVIDRFAPTALKQWLNSTGMGDNPEVFRFVAAMASQLSEDQLIRGTTGASEGKRSPEEILYGKTTPGMQAS